jgi:chemotaxis protein MotB
MNNLQVRLNNKVTITFDRESLWLMTYISLFSTLLAFFMLSLNMLNIETATPKRNFQKIQHQLYLQTKATKEKLGLDWLNVEETLTKGTRLTISTSNSGQPELFLLGSEKLTPQWQSNLYSLVILIERLNLAQFDTNFATLLAPIQAAGYKTSLRLLIEGHTDAQPMHSAKFPSNWELSTARALQIEQLLETKANLPPSYFAIAGLGSFRPIGDINDYQKNRRIEIYITAQMSPKGIAP